MQNEKLAELLKQERTNAWEEAQRYHADLIIGCMKDLLRGDLQSCLEIARHEYEMNDDAFWLRVRDGLLYDLELQRQGLIPLPPPPVDDDDLPF